MTDAWALDRPTILAVSGGRTSMFMLRRYLDHHGGRLPEHAVAVFNNTGREHPKTLDFVQRCSTEWSCPIVWLEYRDAEVPADRWQEVNHNSASRDGEPFAAVIRRKQMLPNQVARFCTVEMKIHCTHRWARAAWPYGGKRYVKAVGFRADEPQRVARSRHRCGQNKDPWDVAWPLFDAGIRKPAILAWWDAQPFNLEIPERLGNCDLCFLKAAWKLGQNIEETPEIADWWIAQQEAVGGYFRSPSRSARPGYDHLRAWATSDALKPWKQGDMIDDMDAADMECACTD